MRHLFAIISLACALTAASTTAFDDSFIDRTLRLDYVFAGNDSTSAIYLEEYGMTEGWVGRRHHLEAPLLRGNGDITVTDPVSGRVLYTNSFSTLFQEWQHTDEAHNVAKAFESTQLVPYPRHKVDITIRLLDNRGNVLAKLTHPFDPDDIMVRHIPVTTAEHYYVHHGGDPKDCVDILIVAEGYTISESEKFRNDAQRAADALLSHEPFASMADRFNIMAVTTLSDESGPDVPRKGLWQRTAHRSHYDTFYSDRYLTTQAIHGIYDSVAGLPAEHIILLVNTPIYGGGGIFNQITICSSDHPTFKQVLVHEFGHAYAGLADEYFYGDDDTTYPLDAEPWEPNITTMTDFASKWADMLPEGTPIPTPVGHEHNALGVYEGAGYRIHGIYRPVDLCRMRVNEVDYFCPVCTRAIIAITDWYTSAED